jgi:colicin import membrane protein
MGVEKSMVKVQRVWGERPGKTVVRAETVEFDEKGFAEVSEEAAAVLAQIPNEYVLVDAKASEAEAKEKADKEAAEAQAKADAEAKEQADKEAADALEAEAQKAEAEEAAEAQAKATPKIATPPKRKAPATK